MSVKSALLIFAVPAFALAACTSQPEDPVSDVHVRLPAVSGRPGAAYFTLNGGEKGRSLASVSTPSADRAEMHDMTMSAGMMTMAPINGPINVPANATLRFKPEGKHLMLMGMKPGLKAGDAIPLRFTFANGETVTVSAKAEATGGTSVQDH